MCIFKKLFTFILLSFMGMACAAIDLNTLQSKLTSEGLTGEIHGASESSSLFVFTYRNPNDFFENIQLPLISEDLQILEILKTTKRHQFYKIKGDFADNKAPIKHIKLSSIELVKDYKSEVDTTPHSYKFDLNNLRNKKDFIGRIHAIANEGKVLVMEYGDRIVPILVNEPPTQALVKNFYRGDLVKVRYVVRGEPDAPIHLSLERQRNLGNDKPIELIESLVLNHDKQISKTGFLVKFPKSPQINFNIYALLQEDMEGTNIQYTLVNFENPELFKTIREKLEDAWNNHAKNVQNERNKLVARNIVVTASGPMNMVDQGQANPQILIQKIDDLKIEIK